MDITGLDTPRYLLVKFVPDMARMEPRNVGIIVWSRKGTAARFVGEKPSASGDIDGRNVPGYIGDVLPGYKQWVKFLRTEIQKPEVEPYYGGAAVSAESGAFLDTIKTSARGNFLIEEGGVLLDQLPSGAATEQFADYLFQTLVGELDDVKDLTLQTVAERALQKASIKNDPHFRSDYEVPCRVGKITDKLKFSHAYVNGSTTLVQKVSFPLSLPRLQTNVHDTAFKFEHVVRARIIERAQGCALVYVTPERKECQEIIHAIDLLSEFADVYNLYDQESKFVKKLEQLQLPATRDTKHKR